MVERTDKTERAAEASSNAVKNADALRFLENPDYKEAYQKAARLELVSVEAYKEIGSSHYIPHLVSAAWCAVHACNADLSASIYRDLEQLKNGNRLLLKELKSLKKEITRLIGK